MTVTPVGDLVHVLQPLRDEDHPDPSPLQFPDDAEESRGLVCREGTRRLVEDQDSGVDGECPGDRDHLALVRA